MAVYLVSPTANGDQIRVQAVAFVGEENVADIGNGSFLIALSEPMVISKIKDSIGIGSGKSGKGVLFKIADYSGYASKSIWEWLEIQDF